jgi:hypothetical protein
MGTFPETRNRKRNWTYFFSLEISPGFELLVQAINWQTKAKKCICKDSIKKVCENKNLIFLQRQKNNDAVVAVDAVVQFI